MGLCLGLGEWVVSYSGASGIFSHFDVRYLIR